MTKKTTTIILLGVICGLLATVAVGVSELSKRAPATNEQAGLSADWFEARLGEIETLDQEIVVAKETFERHKKEVEERSGLFSISRKEDRAEAKRLNNLILKLEQQRIDTINRYNSTARIHSNVNFGRLPQEIPLRREVEKE
jgi:hypothetical protein